MPTRKVSNNLTAELPRSLVINQKTPVDIQDDEFRGMGGSYIVDPATGKRVRVAGPDVGADEQESGAIVTTETEKADEIE